jgi:3-deoxy-manno-octulosonate cytidylyltransferase (CMP-KDO synthetase)
VNYTGSKPPSNPKTNVVAIIPARYDSVRLPGKALLEIAGKPMICWVVERALAARNVARAIVATDDERIVEAVKSAGYDAVMTRGDHASGTDRIAEVATGLEDADIIVNVQGDEPLISPLTIERAVEAITRPRNRGKGEGEKAKAEDAEETQGENGKGERVKGKAEDAETRRRGDTETSTEMSTETDTGDGREVGIVTTWEPMECAADVLNPDVVKVVVDDRERAICFSRSPVPYPRDAVRAHGSIEAAILVEPALLRSFRKHTGLYVYRRDVLLAFAQWPRSELERVESLEQLRALEHGVKIKVIKASTSSISVDTSEDLERVRRVVEEETCSLEYKL